MTAFSISGIRVRLDGSWFIAFFFFAWTLSEGYFPLQAPNYRPLTYWIFGTISALALFGSVLTHELSHCVVARRLGVHVRQVTLFIFGGVSEMDKSHPDTPAFEFKIAMAGPMSSLGLALLFGGLSALFGHRIGHIAAETLHYLIYVNVLLAVFNLIPGFPLDGGRILRSYLWHRSGSLGRASRSAARTGSLVAACMIAVGLASLLTGGFVIGIWLAMIGLFLKKSAEAEYRSFMVRDVLEHVRVGEIMSPPVAVHKGMTITELVNDYVFRYHDRVFPVLDRDRFIGMIDVRAFRKLKTDDWPNTFIDAYLADESLYAVLDPDMQASGALRFLVEHPMSKAPVVRGETLLGVLTRVDLVEVIALKTDLAA